MYYVSVYAHGAYETIEEAYAAIKNMFGEVRQVECDPDVVAAYKLGKFEPLVKSYTIDWVNEGAKLDITADTTDERIMELVAEYEEAANKEGFTLDTDSLEDFLKSYRAEKFENKGEK